MEIIINGIKTNYQVFGEGPSPTNFGLKENKNVKSVTGSKLVGDKPFLILHGWGSNSERWQEVGEFLAEKGLKVIIPDMPGFGKSDIPETPWNFNNYVSWAEKFAENLNLENFCLLGHSFGGAIAVKITVNTPQKISKLFLVSSACIRKRTGLKNILAKLSKIVKIFSFLPYYLLFRKAFYKFVIRKSDYIYTEGVMKETYLKAISEDLSHYLSFIKSPSVIIWGDKDESTPIENAYFINKKIKNSKLVIISGAGHNLNRKSPHILAEKIIENLSPEKRDKNPALYAKYMGK